MIDAWIHHAVYRTAYGIAQVIQVEGRGARLLIIAPSDEATRGGWVRGRTFVANLDDHTDPSPRVWTQVET